MYFLLKELQTQTVRHVLCVGRKLKITVILNTFTATFQLTLSYNSILNKKRVYYVNMYSEYINLLTLCQKARNHIFIFSPA